MQVGFHVQGVVTLVVRTLVRTPRILGLARESL